MAAKLALDIAINIDTNPYYMTRAGVNKVDMLMTELVSIQTCCKPKLSLVGLVLLQQQLQQLLLIEKLGQFSLVCQECIRLYGGLGEKRLVGLLIILGKWRNPPSVVELFTVGGWDWDGDGN